MARPGALALRASGCDGLVPAHAGRGRPLRARAGRAGFFLGPRMVLARRDDTDARPSIIEQARPNYLSVFSGKIDRCLWVAEDVARRLRA